MGIDYTMTGIVADLKRSGAMPTHQSLFQDDDFINLMSDDMKTVIVPMLMSVVENHFQTEYDTTVIVDVDTYSIPWRAIGNKLKAVEIFDTDGTSRLATLARLDLRDVASDVSTSYSSLSGFRMEGSDVVLSPINVWTGKTLRMTYFRRPNNLVSVNDTGQVVAIDAGTGVVQLDNVPTAWTTTDTLDCIKNEPPFKAVAEEQAITLISGFDVTFSSVPTNLAIGDYVALKGQSPIPQIPYDAFPLLSQRGVVAALSAVAPQAAAGAEKTYMSMEKKFVNMISPRVDDAPKKLVNRRGIWQSIGTRRWPS